MSIRPSFKIHGGKHYLKGWLHDHFPRWHTYNRFVDTHCGANSEYLEYFNPKRYKVGNRPLSYVLNDINPYVYATLTCLSRHALINRLYDSLKSVLYNETEFLCKQKYIVDLDTSAVDLQRNNDKLVEMAAAWIVVSRFSRGGRGKSFAWSKRLRGGLPGDLNSWSTYLKSFLRYYEYYQFKPVQIEIYNEDALTLIPRYNHPETFIYCDPPYLPITRSAKKVYMYEQERQHHILLAQALNNHRGPAAISGYDSKLYHELYAANKWNIVRKRVVNHSGEGKKKQPRVECLWTNYVD